MSGNSFMYFLILLRRSACTTLADYNIWQQDDSVLQLPDSQAAILKAHTISSSRSQEGSYKISRLTSVHVAELKGPQRAAFCTPCPSSSLPINELAFPQTGYLEDYEAKEPHQDTILSKRVSEETEFRPWATADHFGGVD
ncbi:MAG: hypothetical protein Q9213_000735 [Squamulea squamosa]